MCAIHTYMHACVHIQHICMHICIASLTKSVRSIPLRDPLSKNRAYADIQKRTPEFVLWLSYACVHTCMGTQTHVHLPTLTQTHTKNHLEGMPFEKQQWPRSMKAFSFLQEWRKVLGPFIMHQSNPWPSEHGDCTCVDREKAWGNCTQRNNVTFIHYPNCSWYQVTWNWEAWD